MRCFIACLALSGVGVLPAADRPPRLGLSPLFRVEVDSGRQRFQTQGSHPPAFLAVITNEWPASLVPVFQVEKTNRFELRRRPVRGQENSSVPLFFALPNVDEPDAARIAGQWHCDAVRSDGSRAYPVWQLAFEQGQIAGRFDPNTEYRYADIRSGTFRSNHFELRVEYVAEVYQLVGEWRAGQLRGTWRHTNGTEQSTWEAEREPAPPWPEGEIGTLYEWRRSSDDARHYALDDERPGPEWQRTPRPLGRVWRRAPGR